MEAYRVTYSDRGSPTPTRKVWWTQIEIQA
jgi:uncharacterized protein (UPF0248 family)